MSKIILLTVLAGLGAGTVLADFSYQESSKITGGALAGAMKFAGAFSKAAREPMVSTVLVKGHTLAHVRRDSTEVIDVDKETITHIDFQKKTYSVMTFAQMKQMMEEMSQEMQKKSNKDQNADVQFKASVKDTGQTKDVNGLTAKEMILTLTMEGTDKQTGQTGAMDMTSDMWLAPVAGYEEVRKVQRLMAAKLGFVPGQNFGAMMQRPDMQKGFADLYKEASKLEGLPVLMITRMGGQGSGEGIGTAQQQGQGQQSEEQQSKMGRLGNLAGGLGGFGGFGRKKKAEQPPQEQQPSNAPAGAQGGGLLMELTT